MSPSNPARQFNLNDEDLIHSFIGTAREFIDLVDQRNDISVETFLASCQRLLPLIFNLAVQLPSVDCEDDDLPDPPNEDDLLLSDYLGEFDSSHQIWNPIGSEREPVYHGLGDDLADIYRDLKRPLNLYDKWGETVLNRCVYDWKSGFSVHYGAHLASAIKTLYWRLRDL